LTASGIEERLDVLEAVVRCRNEGIFDDDLVIPGLGRQRMRDLRGLLPLIEKIPRQQQDLVTGSI
jgi:hypothetical protein